MPTVADLADNDAPSLATPAFRELLEPSKVMAALEQGVDAFFDCTSCIFYIYDRAEAQQALLVARECIQNTGRRWPEIIFMGSVPANQKASVCSACIIAAVGLQYTRDPIPDMPFVSSKNSRTFQYVNIFYEMSKHLLEATIESNILAAIKVCAASCLFNTILHATVALANAGMSTFCHKRVTKCSRPMKNS